MLERVESVRGIGLLYGANGKPHKLEQVTLVYADNGRGKSTLTTILRSASINDPSLILACRTVDGVDAPEVVLQFGSGHKVTFQNGTWSETRPEFLIFDADFIGRNVHSGGEVSTDHRRHLLEFALGDAAVAARRDVEQATADSRIATQGMQNAEQALSAYHVGMSLAQFERLTQVPDVDVQITRLQKRITDANNVAAIQAQPVPKAIPEPKFYIDSLFADLALSVADVHEEAEARVKQHIAKLGGKGAEAWLSQGRQFVSVSTCPYCDQDIRSNDLVRAYQAHFDAAYANLKNKVATLERSIAASYAPTIVDGFAQNAEVASARCAAWSGYVSLPALTFDRQEADAALTAFRDFVGDLVNKKQLAPLDPVGSSEDKAEAVTLWHRVMAPLHAVNGAIQTADDTISKYKAQLSTESIEHLQRELNQLNLTKFRYDPKIVDLFNKLSSARQQAGVADVAKKNAREKLDQLMAATLRKYQVSINALLQNFGAKFSIEGMGANFRGNAPRAEYGLLMRGKSISVEAGTPPFAKALSDGDKRTLAFAFFVASALEDPKLAERVVIIDDPMCSLDRNRRHHTRAVLKKIGAKAAQLIVLAHDAYFLRDLRDALRRDDKIKPVALVQLVAAPHEYTDFSSVDIDKECESPFARHHRLLVEFARGHGGDPNVAAKAIRPLLEGYLHRRFPGLLPKGVMFGQVIDCIRSATAPNPLCHAQSLVGELTEVNDYAGQFHHDTNPDADMVTATANELTGYVNRALLVVHGGFQASSGS